MDFNDLLHTGQQEIGNLFSYFYSYLLASNPTNIDACLHNLVYIVSDEKNDALFRDFTTIDVQLAMFQMNPLGVPDQIGF